MNQYICKVQRKEKEGRKEGKDGRKEGRKGKKEKIDNRKKREKASIRPQVERGKLTL